MLGTVDTTKYTVGDQLLTNCTAKLPVASPALLRGHILVIMESFIDSEIIVDTNTM